MKTFSELKTAAYQLMDEGQSQYLSDAEMGNYVNAAYSELYEIVLHHDPWRLQSEVSLAPVAGVQDYALPNVRRVLRVQQLFNGGHTRRMMQFNPSELNQQWWADCPMYRVQNGQLRLAPIPKVAPSWKVFVQYIPNVVDLAAPTDYTVFCNLRPFEQWIINRAVIYAKLKEEVSVTDFEMQQQALMSAIMTELSFGQDVGEGNHIRLDPEYHALSWYW